MKTVLYKPIKIKQINYMAEESQYEPGYQIREEEQNRADDEYKKKMLDIINTKSVGEAESLLYPLIEKRHKELGGMRDMHDSYAGHNYSLDTYFINLPDGKVVYYDIGGTHQSTVEQVEIMSKIEAEEKKKILEAAARVSEVVSNSVNRGDKSDREKALSHLSFMRGQLDLQEEWLKKVQEEKGEKREPHYGNRPV